MAAALLVASPWLSAPVDAASDSWLGIDGDWSDTTKWSLGGLVPTVGETATFNGAGINTNTTVYLSGSRVLNAGTLVVRNTGTTTFLSSTLANAGGLTPVTEILTANNITINAGAGAVTFGGLNRIVDVAASAGTNTGITNNSSSLLTFNGAFNLASTTRNFVLNGDGGFRFNGTNTLGRDTFKNGEGTATFTGNSNFTHASASAAVGLNGGMMKLVDSGTFTATTTTAAVKMIVTLRRGGEMLLDNSGTSNLGSRLHDTTTIISSLGGGAFTFKGANDAAASETVGALTSASGLLKVTSVLGDDTGTAGTPSNLLTFSSLGARTAGASLVFGGTGLGVDGTNKIVITAAPTLTNHILLGATLGNEFVSYNEDGAGTANSNGIQAVGAAGYSGTFGATTNVKLTAADALGAAANTLNLQTNSASAQLFTLAGALTTNAILNSSSTGLNSIGGAGTISNGDSELFIVTNNDLAISSTLSGNGILTKSGAGTLTLTGTGAARSSAGVFINEGTLKMDNATALYATGAAVSGTVTLGRNAVLEIASGGTLAWSASAANTPSVRLNDNGATVKVSGGTDFTSAGLVTITSQGTTATSDPTRVWLIASAANDTLNLSSALRNFTATTAAPVINLSGAGTVIISGSASNAVALGTANNGSYSWNVTAGKLLVTSSGANPLGLTGNSVAITGATVALGSDNTLGYDYSLNGAIFSGSGGGTRVVASGSKLILTGASTVNLKDAAIGATANMNVTFGGVVSGAGGLTVDATGSGAGTLVLGGANTYTGVTTLKAGTLSVASIGVGGVASGNLGSASNAAANLVFDGGTLKYTGATASSDRGFTINAGKIGIFDISEATTTLTISGASVNSIGALTKSGAGTLILSGTNGYTGATTVSAGTLSYGVSDALSSGDVTVSGGTLDLVSYTDTVGAFAMSSGSVNGTTGKLTATSYALSGGTLNGNLGLGTINVRTGTTTLNGTADSLAVNVNSGTLSLGASDRLANGAAVTVAGGTLGMGANTDTVGSFAMSSGSITGTGTLTAATYALSGGTVNANLGAGALSVSGNTTLNGASGAGTAAINSGTLTLGASGSLAATQINIALGATLDVAAVTGGFALANGQTLSGNGGVVGALTVASGGTLAAGNSIGTLTFADGLNHEGTMNVELDGANFSDLYNVTGLLAIGANSTVNFSILNALTGNVYVFAKYNTWNNVQFGTVTGAPSGWTIDYNYQGTNSFALVAVPEPGAVALGLFGSALLFARRWRA